MFYNIFDVITWGGKGKRAELSYFCTHTHTHTHTHTGANLANRNAMVVAVVVFGQVVEGHHIGVWNELVDIGSDLRVPASALEIKQDSRGAQNGVGCESYIHTHTL